MMIQERESAGYLLGETARLLRVNPALNLAALGALTLVGVLGDVYPDFIRLAGLGTFIITLVLQYEISAGLLVHYDLIEGGGRRRLWALLGLSLLSGIGILLGLILLILPGIYLFVRWAAAVPALIAEEAGVTESMTLSAEAVEGRFWQVFGAIAVVWAPFVPAVLASVMVVEAQPLIGSLLLNLPLNLSLIAGWHLAVAIYAGRRDSNRLAEVFA
jgi:hypothetical protein